MTLREEVTQLLQALIRIDTVNPPGNETHAAEALRAYLARHGVASELLARTSDRANLVARLPGGGGPSLLLMAHTDTVLAEAEEWQRDPWSGDLVDGEVWGRGALDMKGHVAAAAVAFASLAREGARPAGELVLALTADEEVGAEPFGMSWLVANHPDAVRADFAVNEGGGERYVLGGRVFYLCAVGEKATAPFHLRLHGRAGHASDPHAADNALLHAAPVLEALGRLGFEPTLIPEVAAFLAETVGETPPVEQARVPGSWSGRRWRAGDGVAGDAKAKCHEPRNCTNRTTRGPRRRPRLRRLTPRRDRGTDVATDGAPTRVVARTAIAFPGGRLQ